MDYTTTIQASYLEQTATLARERRRERSALVGALLGQQQPDRATVGRVAVALDVDAGARFLVAASASRDDKALRAAADQLAAADRRVHLQDTGRHSVLLLRWEGADSAADTEAPSAVLTGVRCGLGPLAEGLKRVPQAARVAEEVADVLPGGAAGPHRLTDAWVWLVRTRLGDLAVDLAEDVLEGLDGARTGERERLVQTVHTYGTCGSVGATAARLYCHRNTVVNRLRRFTELTGCDPTVPRQAALALLALEWSAAA